MESYCLYGFSEGIIPFLSSLTVFVIAEINGRNENAELFSCFYIPICLLLFG